MNNKKRVKNGLYFCLIGGIMCLAQCIIAAGLRFGYYGGWVFCPNFLIIGTLSLIGAILGLKGKKIGPILCIISGITGIISIIIMRAYILVWFPLYIFGAIFNLIGGIYAYLNFKR